MKKKENGMHQELNNTSALNVKFLLDFPDTIILKDYQKLEQVDVESGPIALH